MLGLLAELLVRTYHESQGKPTYVVRQVVQGGAAGSASQAAGDWPDLLPASSATSDH